LRTTNKPLQQLHQRVFRLGALESDRGNGDSTPARNVPVDMKGKVSAVRRTREQTESEIDDGCLATEPVARARWHVAIFGWQLARRLA